MTSMELIIVLQECPESPYFARDDFETSELEARKLVLSLVERSNFSGHDPHLEANSSSESSSQASKSKGSLEELLRVHSKVSDEM